MSIVLENGVILNIIHNIHITNTMHFSFHDIFIHQNTT